MKILDRPSFEILYSSPVADQFRTGEAIRVCYKTPRVSKVEPGKRPIDNYDLNQDAQDQRLMQMCFRSGHHSVLEHSSMTVRFICDRGVSHELVRHRMASYSQESTRYCNYSKDKFGQEITVVKPIKIRYDTLAYDIWESGCKNAETAYFNLLDAGVIPENARSVLPTSLKTEVVMTANIREWHHVLDLRTARDAQPDIRFMMLGLLQELAGPYMYPVLFKDMWDARKDEMIHDFKMDFKKSAPTE